MSIVTEIAQLRFELEVLSEYTSEAFHEAFREHFPILSSFLPSHAPNSKNRYEATDDVLMEILVSMVEEAIKIGEAGTKGDYTEVGLVSGYRWPILNAIDQMRV